MIIPGSTCVLSQEIADDKFSPTEFYSLDRGQELPLLASIISRGESRVSVMTWLAFDKNGNELPPDSPGIKKTIGQIVTLLIISDNGDYLLGY